MEDTLKMPIGIGDPAVHDYPPEKRYTNWGFGASIGLHVSILVVVGAIAYWQHLHYALPSMTASIPDQQAPLLEVVLIEDKKEPPPTDNPLWVYQVIIPKVKPPPPPPPPPKPKPRPVAKVVPFVPKPQVGDAGLPAPRYPIEALRSHLEGMVLIQVSFDGSGGVISAEVVRSSGSSILDSATRHDILQNWHSSSMSGQSQTWPVQFKLPH